MPTLRTPIAEKIFRNSSKRVGFMTADSWESMDGSRSPSTLSRCNELRVAEDVARVAIDRSARRLISEDAHANAIAP